MLHTNYYIYQTFFQGKKTCKRHTQTDQSADSFDLEVITSIRFLTKFEFYLLKIHISRPVYSVVN